MVIRNAKRRMMGLPVGNWDDEVDPDRVIKEVVGDCQTFLEDDTLQPSFVSKKRKKRVEGAGSRAKCCVQLACFGTLGSKMGLSITESSTWSIEATPTIRRAWAKEDIGYASMDLSHFLCPRSACFSPSFGLKLAGQADF